MTTITVDANLGVMCSDSHWMDEAEKGPMRKVFRINGALVGLSGDLSCFDATLNYLRAGMPGHPPPKADATALILDGKRASVWTRLDGQVQVPARYAIGTGGAAARAALAAGASASKALAIAREIDATTSGRTRVYKLKAT